MREIHYPAWDKDELPKIKVTHKEHILIHEMEYEHFISEKGKIIYPAVIKLVLLYKNYLNNLQFIKAWRLKKVLKMYGFTEINKVGKFSKKVK